MGPIDFSGMIVILGLCFIFTAVVVCSVMVLLVVGITRLLMGPTTKDNFASNVPYTPAKGTEFADLTMGVMIPVGVIGLTLLFGGFGLCAGLIIVCFVSFPRKERLCRTLVNSKQTFLCTESAVNVTTLLSAAANHICDDDYVVLIDRSGSMGGRSWVDTQRTVQFLVTWLNEFVDNGVSLYFFDESCDHVPHVKSAAEVATAFDAHLPRGSTDLARALHGVLRTHLQSMRGATRVLVITDGCPDSYADTKRILTRAARSVSSTKALSISLLQVGTDVEATKYLHHLRDDLAKEAEADIVDIRTTGEYAPLTLMEYVTTALRRLPQ